MVKATDLVLSGELLSGHFHSQPHCHRHRHSQPHCHRHRHSQPRSHRHRHSQPHCHHHRNSQPHCYVMVFISLTHSASLYNASFFLIPVSYHHT